MTNDQWATPKWLMKIFRKWYDPCPLSEDGEEAGGPDGLTLNWRDETYVNPPYSKPLPWVKKAIEENKKGHMIVMLMRMDTSTKWFAMLQEAGAEFLWFNGRLHFNDSGEHANFPSMLVILKRADKTGDSK